jgi:hypothetical protein
MKTTPITTVSFELLDFLSPEQSRPKVGLALRWWSKGIRIYSIFFKGEEAGKIDYIVPVWVP